MRHKSKTILFSAIFLALFWGGARPAHAFFYEWDVEKIIKVIDLPNTDDFRDNDGNYVDVGIKYKQFKILFIPIWNYDKHFCGYIGSDNFYLDLSKNKLDEIAGSVNLSLPDNPQIPLWDAIGGKFVLLLLIGVWIFWKLRSQGEDA